MSRQYKKRPKIACVVCDMFGLAKLNAKGDPVVRPHKFDGKLCIGSNCPGFTLPEQEWVRHQANFRAAKMDSCGNCAHRSRNPIKKEMFLCSVLNQPVHATNVCKHHKQS